VKRSHAYLRDRLKKSDAPIYGVNTGFGSLYDKSIAKEGSAQLQKNLVMSHACGSGDPGAGGDRARHAGAEGAEHGLRAQRRGPATVQRYIDMYNADMLPVVYERGSLGASGDLAPLAHLALPLLGLGRSGTKGQAHDFRASLEEIGLETAWNSVRRKAWRC
jgi:histidine ammonia-lyase